MQLVSREQWGARTPTGQTHRPLSVVDAVVFHYADSGAAPSDPADEAAMVRAIQTFHMQVRGWADIAYHALVGMSGHVYAGRPVDVVGAHTLDFNTPSIGVCFLTDGGISPTAGAAAVQWVQTVEYIAMHRKLTIFGHREKTGTRCPGDLIFGWVGQVREPGGPLA